LLLEPHPCRDSAGFASRASIKEVGPDLQNMRLPSDGKVKMRALAMPPDT
jgi:hypothetical protein